MWMCHAGLTPGKEGYVWLPHFASTGFLDTDEGLGVHSFSGLILMMMENHPGRRLEAMLDPNPDSLLSKRVT